MKKLWILAIAWLATLALAGCNCNKYYCNCPQCSPICEGKLNESAQFCLDNWWTYSQVTAPDEKYGECIFPSGIGCRDDMILNWECNWKADISDIDTAQERQIWCENSVDWWMQDMMEWAVYFGIEWDGDEEEIKDEEWNLVMITRDFHAKYDKDWKHWKLPWRCEANFVDGSNWASYGQEFINEEFIDN